MAGMQFPIYPVVPSNLNVAGSAVYWIDSVQWIVMEPQPALVRGIRVRMAVNDTKLIDCAVSVLARVLETLFVNDAPANSFLQLTLISGQNGSELYRGTPLLGEEALL